MGDSFITGHTYYTPLMMGNACWRRGDCSVWLKTMLLERRMANKNYILGPTSRSSCHLGGSLRNEWSRQAQWKHFRRRFHLHMLIETQRPSFREECGGFEQNWRGNCHEAGSLLALRFEGCFVSKGLTGETWATVRIVCLSVRLLLSLVPFWPAYCCAYCSELHIVSLTSAFCAQRVELPSREECYGQPPSPSLLYAPLTSLIPPRYLPSRACLPGDN